MVSNYGSIGVAAFWNPPPLPTIVAVWISLFPLILHLASSQDDYQMIGELALSGRFQTGMFPKLGLYDGIARLLREGPDFLDQASSQGPLGGRVWDVAFGSIFPCANAAAREMFTALVKKRQTKTINVERWLEQRRGDPTKVAAIKEADAIETKRSKGATFRRWQTLHVIRCLKDVSKPSVPDKVQTFMLSRSADALYMGICLGIAVILCLSSAFGTAAIVLSGGISRLVCRLLPLARPDGFPVSNEPHDACMLTAIHENASTWYLYQGERGPVDWLLNKTMISLQPGGSLLFYYFRSAHFLQLLAMTYVASQQGWDGVCLSGLMIVVWLWQWMFETDQAAAEWVKQCQIEYSISSFEFTGRTPLLGAIQLLQDEWCAERGKKSPGSYWMDEIIVSTPRRNAWTARLWDMATGATEARDSPGLDDFDQNWVTRNTVWTKEAADCIKAHLDKHDSIPSSPKP